MGVLTHLDQFRSQQKLRKAKKELKHRFWTEIYDVSVFLYLVFVFFSSLLILTLFSHLDKGAKLFYLSRVTHGEYPKTEMQNLSRFISVMKFRPLIWRNTHPYVLADR